MDFARKAFDKWVNDPKNLDFRRVFFDDRIGEVGRESLRVHICKPFEITNLIASHSEGWEPSESTEFSIFSYSSIFGSGFPFPIIVLSIQFALPGVLVYVNFSGASLSFEKFFCVQNDEDASMEVVNLTTVMGMYFYFKDILSYEHHISDLFHNVILSNDDTVTLQYSDRKYFDFQYDDNCNLCLLFNCNRWLTV